MIQFGHTIPVGIKNPKINYPKLIGKRIEIDTVDHPDPFDYTRLIARILPPNSLYFSVMNLFQYYIIKNYGTFEPTRKERINFLSKHSGAKLFFFEKARNIVVRQISKVVCQISTSIIDLTGEQVLTVQVARCFHTVNYPFLSFA